MIPQEIFNGQSVAVLCTRRRSVYLDLANTDCYDVKRDALTFSGSSPVVAHPPCRAWGRLRSFALPRPGEKELAHFCLSKVRENGGVLEHPAGSSLWVDAGLPRPGEIPDSFGGFSVSIFQGDFGHPAPKHTWLYVVGVSPGEFDFTSPIVSVPYRSVVSQSSAAREHTPVLFASMLLELAIRCCRG